MAVRSIFKPFSLAVLRVPPVVRRVQTACVTPLVQKSTRFSSSTTQNRPGADEARKENWRRRVDLAAAYRGFEKYSLHEGVCNHLTVMAPAADGSGGVMLIIPFGLHWSEVRQMRD